MKLNSRGDYCAPGSGLGTVSVNGQPIDSAGTDACWLTDDVILAQHCDQTCQIRRFDVKSGEIRTEDPAGANWLRAGGGVWRAWLNGHVRGNGFAYDGYLCDVSPEGHTVTAPPSFDSLTVWGLNAITNIATGPILSNATSGPNVRLRDGTLLWQGTDGVVHLQDGSGPYAIAKRTETIYFAVQVWENSRGWLIEQSGRLTARLLSETKGYVITDQPVYGIDARYVNGKIRIVWASSPGEPPEHQHVFDQDLSKPRVELNDTPPPDPIPVPPAGVAMISYSVVNVKDAAKSKPENYLTGERKTAGSGFAIKQANGYYLTITPEGDVSQRPEGNVSPDDLAKYVPGAWETFYASGNIAVAEREKGNNGGKPNACYWFPCVGK